MAVLRTYWHLGRLERRLAREAIVLTTAVSLGLRVLPFPVLQRSLSRVARVPEQMALAEDHIVALVRWAVMASARRVPRATCLVQALAAETMLRRRGLSPEIRIGVRPSRASAPLDAHAWVLCRGVVAIGTVDGLTEYRVLTKATPQ